MEVAFSNLSEGHIFKRKLSEGHRTKWPFNLGMLGIRKADQACRTWRADGGSWTLLSRSYGRTYFGHGRCSFIRGEGTRSCKYLFINYISIFLPVKMIRLEIRLCPIIGVDAPRRCRRFAEEDHECKIRLQRLLKTNTRCCKDGFHVSCSWNDSGNGKGIYVQGCV